ncbi:pca operon transcription factor PcaQ [Paralimibaculum aggregatum]|uniref:Pca operon transcription factor PcaQ n=1 Tax=Paralimibaculum aggregatum TaxID=3036245 RepID=A0ABQ6LFP9_9RHOB|nr:pca operon transcription factor PcaQ [Limibaculum sp. NKW23]
MNRRIKLRHLRCFHAVARQGSLAGAAAALALTQPAVTKTLQDLEAILGVRLVERGRKGAELTAHGRVFLPRAAACLGELERAVTSVSRSRERAEWTVRIGALPTVAAGFVPVAIRAFRAEGATAPVRVVAGPNLHLLGELREDRLDLVVGRLAAPEAMGDLAFLHLYSEPVRLVVRAGHPLLAQVPLEPGRIADYPVILPDADAVIRPSVERLLIAHGIGELPERIESVSTSFGRAVVLDSEAVWIISEGVVARDLADGTFVALAIDTADTSGPVGLTTRPDLPLRPGVELMIDAIRRVARRGPRGRAGRGAPD